MAATGRPSKFSPEKQAEIVALVENGDAPHVAAGACGIGRQTYYDWMRRGEMGEEPFACFRNEITRARDHAESSLRQKALDGDDKGISWGPSRAAFEVLGRRYPNRWAPRVKHEIVESQRLMLEALQRVCSEPEIVQRVCEKKDCGVVFLAVCEELARLDGEDDSGRSESADAHPVH